MSELLSPPFSRFSLHAKRLSALSNVMQRSQPPLVPSDIRQPCPFFSLPPYFACLRTEAAR